MSHFWAIVAAAARPELKLVLLILVGVGVEVSTPGGFGAGRVALARLIRSVFVPSLVFTRLGSSDASTDVVGWWPIPFLICFNVVAGLGLGAGLSRLLFPDSPPSASPASPPVDSTNDVNRVSKALLPLAVGIGNYGNLPIVMLSTLCADSSSPLTALVADPATCERKTLTWAVVGMACGQLTMWSFSLPLLERARDAAVVAPTAGPKATAGSRVKTAFLNPPILSSVAALVVAMTPPLQHAVFGASSVLRLGVEALEVIAGGFVPAVTILLGSSLASTWSNTDTDAVQIRGSVVGGAVVLRLVVLPTVCAAVQIQLYQLGWLGAAAASDPLFRLYLLILTSTPAAINLSTVCNLIGFGGGEAAAMLFPQYLIAPVPIALFIAFYFFLLLPPA
eukprot:m.132672 g.132672  ORF g.132672 m.132672 type:complete len:393 (-) comp13807_c0_seq1:463-1641(-)